jgi:hypothetical protein
LEQVYLDAIPEGLGYNMNPKATGPCMTEESIQRQVESRKEFYKQCLPYYEKIKSGEITIEDVPEEYKQRIQSYLDIVP